MWYKTKYCYLFVTFGQKKSLYPCKQEKIVFSLYQILKKNFNQTMQAIFSLILIFIEFSLKGI